MHFPASSPSRRARDFFFFFSSSLRVTSQGDTAAVPPSPLVLAFLCFSAPFVLSVPPDAPGSGVVYPHSPDGLRCLLSCQISRISTRGQSGCCQFELGASGSPNTNSSSAAMTCQGVSCPISASLLSPTGAGRADLFPYSILWLATRRQHARPPR